MAIVTVPVTCGHCSRYVGAELLMDFQTVRTFEGPGTPQFQGPLWLRCPSCGEGIVKKNNSAVTYPGAMPSRAIQNMPADVDAAWREARAAHSVGAYTASEMMCRKILMHLAVDVAGSKPGLGFVDYVDDLEAKGYIMANLKPVVDIVRKRGNAANHDLSASTEQDSLRTINITEHLLIGIYELSQMGAAPAASAASPPATP